MKYHMQATILIVGVIISICVHILKYCLVFISDGMLGHAIQFLLYTHPLFSFMSSRTKLVNLSLNRYPPLQLLTTVQTQVILEQHNMG